MKTKKQQELDPESRAFFNKIVSEFELTPAGYQLLSVACHTLARWRQAKAILDKEGLVLPGKLARVHPACKIEHDARLSFCRFLKELNLNDELSEIGVKQ